MGNMICGFVSILSVLNQKFEVAAWLIVAAMALDAFDGRLARMMKTTSKMGAQLDSMADLVTFGIALHCSWERPAPVYQISFCGALDCFYDLLCLPIGTV